MPNVVAICDTCGAFFPSGILAENAFEMTLAGNMVGPCPRCGEMGHIPDGTYNFTQDTIELLQGPEATVSELERLAQILHEARERNAGLEEVRQAVREETPELSTLADLLPRNRAELYAFIALILTAIQLLVSSPGDIQNSHIDVDAVISKTIEQHHQAEPPQQRRKVGRNEPCPCGSGKKYKKCHGDPIREQRTSRPR